MFRRSFVVLVLVVPALAACGGKEATVSTTTLAAVEPSAAVLVTTECGAKTVLANPEVRAGETALRTLDRVADIETDDGGKFVTAIEGIEQDPDNKLAWLYYVNGKPAEKGAAEVKLSAGDVEWWDLHNWEKECAVIPAAAK